MFSERNPQNFMNKSNKFREKYKYILDTAVINVLVRARNPPVPMDLLSRLTNTNRLPQNEVIVETKGKCWNGQIPSSKTTWTRFLWLYQHQRKAIRSILCWYMLSVINGWSIISGSNDQFTGCQRINNRAWNPLGVWFYQRGAEFQST